MKKSVKIIIGIVLFVLLIVVLKYFKDSNSADVEEFATEVPFYAPINFKVVATGKLNPEEEIELKPQISGIVDRIVVEEGDMVKKGDLIATIRVVPNEQALVSSNSRIKSNKLALDNAQVIYDRNKTLFEKGVISRQDFENTELSLNQAREAYAQSQNDYQIIKRGSVSGGSGANTSIVAQISGTILEIPVREGDQVIESNNFNAGTTIATIADLSIMIFEGKVDEGEVGKLEVGMPLEISLGAIEDKTFEASLKFIAPKGVEEAGTVQFKIEGDVKVEDDFLIRAGYSANASLILERKEDILVMSEALLQFDRDTDKPFVEVSVGDQEFERRDVEIGISDGINVEVLSGVTQEDNIKIWNKTEPIKKGGDTEEEEA